MITTSIPAAAVAAVDVKGVPKRGSPESAAVSSTSSAKPSGETSAQAKSVDRDEAGELAKKLERAINDAHSADPSRKEVKFNVAANESGPNSFSFQVVDSQTGEIVREFPADAVRKLASRSNLQDGQGVFFDSPA